MVLPLNPVTPPTTLPVIWRAGLALIKLAPETTFALKVAPVTAPLNAAGPQLSPEGSAAGLSTVMLPDMNADPKFTVAEKAETVTVPGGLRFPLAELLTSVLYATVPDSVPVGGAIVNQ